MRGSGLVRRGQLATLIALGALVVALCGAAPAAAQPARAAQGILGTISGTVTNASGAPVAGVTVTPFSSGVAGSSATTGADGTYTIDLVGVSAGDTIHVEFTAIGYTTQWYENQPSEATATPLTLTVLGQNFTGIDAQLQVAPPNSATLAGTVYGTGNPLAGATVIIHNYFGFDVAQTTTDSAGNWTVTNLGAGVYRVEFEPPAGSGLLGQWWNNSPDLAHSDGIAVAPGPTVGNINGFLTSGSTISGEVSGSPPTGPVAGAAVALFTATPNGPGAEIAHATTAADGNYSFSGLQAGTYFVLFDAPAGSALVGQWFNLSPTAGGATTVTVSAGGAPGSATANALLTTGQRGSISGTVKDRSGSPISGVTVEAVAGDGTTTTSATSAADGTYRINNLDVGIYTVWFVPPAGSSYRASVWNLGVGKILPVTVDQGANVPGINATLSQNGTVTGTVTGPSGPIAGATVTVANYYGFPESSATTAADGSYTVTGLSSGPSRVEFTAAGFVTQWWNNEPDLAHSDTISVPNGGTATATATLAPSG